MTHEHRPNAEAHRGPEHDHSLPNAVDVPTFSTPEESDLPPIEETPVGPWVVDENGRPYRVPDAPAFSDRGRPLLYEATPDTSTRGEL